MSPLPRCVFPLVGGRVIADNEIEGTVSVHVKDSEPGEGVLNCREVVEGIGLGEGLEEGSGGAWELRRGGISFGRKGQETKTLRIARLYWVMRELYTQLIEYSRRETSHGAMEDKSMKNRTRARRVRPLRRVWYSRPPVLGDGSAKVLTTQKETRKHVGYKRSCRR